jgi:hypothetical protein
LSVMGNPSWPRADLSWTSRVAEARRRKRLARFVSAQLQPNEQIVAILSLAFQQKTYETVSEPAAVVVTDYRVFVIRLSGWDWRPNEILEKHPADGVEPNCTYDAFRTSQGQAGGRLSLAGPFGLRIFWTDARTQYVAADVAKALEDLNRGDR